MPKWTAAWCGDSIRRDGTSEASCRGLLFYGAHGVLLLLVPDAKQAHYAALLNYINELHTRDTIQGEKLRTILTRLIILLTCLA